MSNQDRNWEVERVIALSNGNVRAFDDLFKLHGKRLYHFALGYLKSVHDAEEIVQDVFLKIWKNRKKLNSGYSFKSYLFTIAYRQIAETLRKRLKTQRKLEKFAARLIPMIDAEEERINFQSMLELVSAAIAHLPERQRDVMVMQKFAGLRISEIAKELQISPKTVESHLNAGKKRIKENLLKMSCPPLHPMNNNIMEG